MDAFLTFLTNVIATQQFLQVFVGGCTMLLIGWMVTRARGDRDVLPPPAPTTLSDVPQPFTQGPREVVDLMRESREFLRRIAEDSARIAECVRITREESKKQTDLLHQIVTDQKVEFALQAERGRHPHG